MGMIEEREADEFEAFRMIRVPILPQQAGMPLLEVLRAHVMKRRLRRSSRMVGCGSSASACAM